MTIIHAIVEETEEDDTPQAQCLTPSELISAQIQAIEEVNQIFEVGCFSSKL
jgi:hypothetical protein